MIHLTRDEVLRACELPADAVELVRGSSSESHTAYNRRRGMRAASAIADFFHLDHFQGRRIIELGPGHYSFSLLARHLGAHVVCVEYDPALCELGRRLGFEVHQADLDRLQPDFFPQPFDGLWLKGCLNACRLESDQRVAEVSRAITGLLRPDGWGWLVPCNKGHDRREPGPAAFVRRRVELQTRSLADLGWTCHDFDLEQRKRYASAYANAPYLFTRNLGR